jgi:hypothetical protein
MNFLKQFGFTIITLRLIGILSVASVTPGQAESAEIEHRIPSPYQAGDTSIRILLPDTMEEGKRYRALYVLPVRPEDDERHGQGLEEVRRLDIHNQFEVICITPAFSATPWYNNHATDPQRQDEKHFLETVLPFVEAEYPLRQDADGRLLLGFSKSGWGAISLLLKYPEMFGKVAVWDTGIRADTGPLEETDRNQRVQDFWGSAENFERYRLSNLVKIHGSKLGPETRLLYYVPVGNRALGGARFHQFLVEKNIPHRYVFEPRRRHSWESGWMPEAVAFLFSDR